MPKGKKIGHNFDILTEKFRDEIYKWAAEGRTDSDICKCFNRQYPPEVTGRDSKLQVGTLRRIMRLPEAEQKLGKFRKEFLTSVKDIPIVEKKVRLQDLEILRRKTMHMINNLNLGGTGVNANKFLSLTKKMTEILSLAKDEMEPKNGVHIGIDLGGGGVDDLSDEELQKEREELIRKAGLTIEQGSKAFGEITEDDEGKNASGSSEVFLASPEELQRTELRQRKTVFSDIRQQTDGNSGVSSV